jgi:hypothetical protein
MSKLKKNQVIITNRLTTMCVWIDNGLNVITMGQKRVMKEEMKVKFDYSKIIRNGLYKEEIHDRVWFVFPWYF